MYRYLKGWQNMPYTHPSPNYSFATKVSVLLPARNEEDNIEACIISILNQKYPHSLLEIIVIDDYSTDKTPDIVKGFDLKNVTLLSLADFVNEADLKAFKKKAIELAIQQSTGDLIITVDADCIAGDNWLPVIVEQYETQQAKFIAAPVSFHQDRTLFEKFQALDFHGMMVITGGGIYGNIMNMCNGANLAFDKAAFHEVGGYKGVDNFASGDDMMLIQKMAAAYPNGIIYIKNATACTYTTPKPTIRSFFNQRVRWTTKARNYEEWKMTAILGLVWLFCLSIPITIITTFFFGYAMLWIALGQLLLKAFADYRLLHEASRFFNRLDLMATFIPSSFMHLAYIITVGFWGNVAKEYEWKGRRVR